MPKDDYFRLQYVILKELYRCMRNGIKIDTEDIKPEALGIPEAYRDDILIGMKNDGYVDGFVVGNYLNGRQLVNLSEMSITPAGIRYLSENTSMKKVEKFIKTAREFIPR